VENVIDGHRYTDQEYKVFCVAFAEYYPYDATIYLDERGIEISAERGETGFRTMVTSTFASELHCFKLGRNYGIQAKFKVEQMGTKANNTVSSK